MRFVTFSGDNFVRFFFALKELAERGDIREDREAEILNQDREEEERFKPKPFFSTRETTRRGRGDSIGAN
jgi:hypothetical protein